jgi:hypothetical protein
MRILHLICSPHRNDAQVALILGQSERVAPLVMAPEGAASAEALAQAGIPVLWRKPSQSIGHIADAMQVLQPDLVHLHGARDSEGVVPLRVFSNRPLVMELNAADCDSPGQLRRDLRGLRLDWRGGHPATALCPKGLLDPDVAISRQLPASLCELLWFDPDLVSAHWFLALYRRLLLSKVPAGKEMALPGLA